MTVHLRSIPPNQDTGRSGVIKLVICYTRVRPEHDGLFEIGTGGGAPPPTTPPLVSLVLTRGGDDTVTPTQIHTLLASSKEEMNLWLSAIATVLHPRVAPPPRQLPI
jgi:hypothetical protein